MNQPESKLGFNATWSMAVGGMVGGGIFSTLGVVVGIAGAWAWLSFAAAGLIALTAGYSYVKLSAYYGEGAERSLFSARSMQMVLQVVCRGFSSSDTYSQMRCMPSPSGSISGMSRGSVPGSLEWRALPWWPCLSG